MSLLDMLESSVGSAALNQIGARTGLSPAQLQMAVGALAPMLLPKLAAHVGGGALPATQPQPGSEAAVAHGNDILGAIFGSKDVSRSVAADASQQTGIGTDQLKALLPQLASVAAGALAARQGQGGAGGIGDLLGGLLGGMGR